MGRYTKKRRRKKEQRYGHCVGTVRVLRTTEVQPHGATNARFRKAGAAHETVAPALPCTARIPPSAMGPCHQSFEEHCRRGAAAEWTGNLNRVVTAPCFVCVLL